ncbi:MAG: 30S ribosomal protein S6 [bacterium]
MRCYECMLIVNSQVKEEEVEKLIKKVEKIVEKHSGEIKKVTKLGLKKLANPIKHKREGIYYLLNLEIDPVSIKEYENILKLSNIVLRFLTQTSTAPVVETQPVKEEPIKEEA